MKQINTGNTPFYGFEYAGFQSINTNIALGGGEVIDTNPVNHQQQKSDGEDETKYDGSSR